ncbi:MAG TPA: hypothetical protein VK986_01095 [Tepidisphaeraceae bacterium]|nr:hypothetical protein [Tepidisphaeraceae bacterium]
MANRPRKNTLRKEEKLARERAEQRRGYAAAARLVGVADLLAKFPEYAMRQMYEGQVLEPAIVPADPVSAAHPAAGRVTTTLRRAMRAALMNLEDGRRYPAAHVLTYVYGLRLLFESAAKCPDPTALALGRAGLPRALATYEQYQTPALLAQEAALRLAAAEHARMDSVFVSFKADFVRTPTGRNRFRFPFTLTPPITTRLTIDGAARPAFRVGGHQGCMYAHEWTDWAADVLGGPADAPPLPVYIQSHALARVEERLKAMGTPAARLWMWEGLRNPTVTAIDGDKVTVEFKFFEYRVGYMVGRRVPNPAGKGDAIVITTFLFLTMAGTPEARRLHDALRLRRDEIAYQRLDELETYTNSDLLDDPDLLTIFRECGCGHLADMRDKWAGLMELHGDIYQTSAGEVRRFLRLDEARQRRSLEARLGLDLPGLESDDDDYDALPEAA